MADATPPAEVTEGEATEVDQPVVSGKPTIAVKVYAPFKMYYEGDAFSVSAVNETGPFDILPRHHNFLCMLVPCVLKIQTAKGTTETVKVHRALMHVKADSVVVFMDV